MRRVVLLALLTLARSTAAPACPVCDSETGIQVREELINNHLGLGIAAISVPFLLLGGLVAIVHAGTPTRRRR